MAGANQLPLDGVPIAKESAVQRCCTAGTTKDAKDVATSLIRDVGVEPLDAGPLRIARYLEPFSLGMTQLAYERDE
jgi:predicted dinucleotide-binding enzyme